MTQLALLIMYPSYTPLVRLATLCQDNHTSHLRLMMSGEGERTQEVSRPLFMYPI